MLSLTGIQEVFVISMEEVAKSHWKCTRMVVFDRNHAISHRNPSAEIIVCTRKGTPSEIAAEGFPVIRNHSGSVFALLLDLPARTLRGAVLRNSKKEEFQVYMTMI